MVQSVYCAKIFLDLNAADVETLDAEKLVAWKIRQGIAEDVEIPEALLQYSGLEEEITFAQENPCCAIYFNILPPNSEDHCERTAHNICSEILLRCYDAAGGIRKKPWPCSLIRSAVSVPARPPSDRELAPPSKEAPAERRARQPHLPPLTPAAAAATMAPAHGPAAAPAANIPATRAAQDQDPVQKFNPAPAPQPQTSEELEQPHALQHNVEGPKSPEAQQAPVTVEAPPAPVEAAAVMPPEQFLLREESSTDPEQGGEGWNVMMQVCGSRCFEPDSSFYCCVSLVHPVVLTQGKALLRHDPGVAGTYGPMPGGNVHVRPMYITSIMRGNSSTSCRGAEMGFALESLVPYETRPLSSERVMLFMTVHKMGVREAGPIGTVEMLLARGVDLDIWLPLQNGVKTVIDPSSGNASLINIRVSHQELSNPEDPVKHDKSPAPTESGIFGFQNWMVDSLGALGRFFDGSNQQAAGHPASTGGYRQYVIDTLRDTDDKDAAVGDDVSSGPVELELVEGAAKALKALADSDWELVLLSVADTKTAQVALRELRECGLAGGPVADHNIIFVSQWRQMPLVVSRLQGVSTAVAPRWSPLASLSVSVSGGMHCILINPSLEDRLSFYEAQTILAKDEIYTRDVLQDLAKINAKMEDVKRRSQEAGFSRDLLEAGSKSAEEGSGYDASVHGPSFDALVGQYRALKLHEKELLRRAQPLAKLGPSTLSISPNGPRDASTGGDQAGRPIWETAWSESCQLLGIEREKMLMYDDRKYQSSIRESNGLVQEQDPRPFFPLRDEALRKSSPNLDALNSNFSPTQTRGRVGIVLECGGRASQGRDEWCVSKIIPGSSADRRGIRIKVGDRCLAINGRVMHPSMSADLVNGMLEGAPGSSVLLNIVREGGTPDLVLLFRNGIYLAPSGAKGRIVIDVASVLRPKTQSGPVGRVEQELVVTVQKSANLARDLDGQVLTCRLNISGPPPHFLPSERLSEPAKVFAGVADFSWSSRTALIDPEKQMVTVEVIAVGGNAIPVGIINVSVVDFVAGGSRWHILRDHDGAPIAPRESSGQPQLLIDAHIFSAQLSSDPDLDQDRQNAGGHSIRPACALLTLDEVLDPMEKRFGGKSKLKEELALDIAASLKADSERIQVVAVKEVDSLYKLPAGQKAVEVRINFLPSKSHLDSRTSTALIHSLLALLKDKSSSVYVAATTQNAFESLMQVPVEPQEEDVEGINSVEASGPGGEKLTSGDSFTVSDLSVTERSKMSLKALSEGAAKSRIKGASADPAIIAITLRKLMSEEKSSNDNHLFRQAVARSLSIDIILVHIGSQSEDGTYLELVISNPSRSSSSTMENQSSDRLVPGMQHQCAGQFVSHVFDPKKPLMVLRDATANRITWAQVITESTLPATQKLLATLPGYQSEPSVDESGHMLSGASEKIWISDPILGRVWEEIEGKKGKVWLDHSRKVMSRCHPTFLAPLPQGWKEQVDVQRQIYYVDPETGKSQWDHPLAGAVVYGVAIHGSSDTSVKLRRFIRETGWIDIEARLKKESFASDIKVISTGKLHQGLYLGAELLAEHSFITNPKTKSVGASFADLCKEKCYTAAPTTSAPANGETFHTMPAYMAQAMLKQYPPEHYMIFSQEPSQQTSHPAFEQAVLSYTDKDSNFDSKSFHIVKEGSGWETKYAGSIVTHPDQEPWNSSAEELINGANLYGNLDEFIKAHNLVGWKRIDTFTLLPSTRFRDMRLDTRFVSIVQGEDAVDIEIDAKLSFYGRLGVTFDQVAGAEGSIILISKVSAGSPGAAAGLQRGDVVKSINGESTIGLGAANAMDMVAGATGDVVRIIIRRKAAVIA